MSTLNFSHFTCPPNRAYLLHTSEYRRQLSRSIQYLLIVVESLLLNSPDVAQKCADHLNESTQFAIQDVMLDEYVWLLYDPLHRCQCSVVRGCATVLIQVLEYLHVDLLGEGAVLTVEKYTHCVLGDKQYLGAQLQPISGLIVRTLLLSARYRADV